MCLIIGKNQKPQVATKPITVYKVICYHTRLTAPYQEYLYGYPKNLPIKLKDKHPFNIIDWGIVNGVQVTSGGFHSLARIEDVEIIAALFNGNYDQRFKIFECTIPVGARYYEGYFNEWKAYCSKQLIIEKLCV